MRIAIMIQAHKSPHQLARLVEQLRHPNVDIFVNLDLNTDFMEFADIVTGVKYVFDRVKVKWGTYSQVEATIRSMKQAMGTAIEYVQVIFISGQDYPIIPMEHILDFFVENKGKQFVSYMEIGSEKNKYHRDMEARYRYPWFNFGWGPLNTGFNRLCRLTGLMRRKNPVEKVYKGSSWLNLTSPCVRYILDTNRINPELGRFYKRTKCPDEIFFHTLIMNSEFADRTVNKNYRYVDWSRGGKHPAILTAKDFDKIIATNNWFARKFDMEVDSEILDMLDRHLERQRREWYADQQDDATASGEGGDGPTQ